MVSRAVKESPQPIGEDEVLKFSLTTTPWASSPASVSVVAKDITTDNWTVVTSTILSGSASATGDVITWPSIQTVTAGHKYRVECKWTSGSSTYKCYLILEAEV